MWKKFLKSFNVHMPSNTDLGCSSERKADEKHEKYVKINPTVSGISQEEIIILLSFLKSDLVVAGDGESQYSQ